MNAGYENAMASIDESFRKLQTGYIDLLLIDHEYAAQIEDFFARFGVK